MKHKFFTLFLLLATGVGIIFAGENIIASGSCGTNATYSLNDEGICTINGTGAVTSAICNYNNLIKHVIISDSIESIDAIIMPNAPLLKSVTVGKGLKSITGTAFCNSDNSNKIKVIWNAKKCTVSSYTSAFNYTKIDTIIFGNEVEYIPCISTHASSVTEVVIPNSVKEIGASAFYTFGISSVTIPDSVTEIGEAAFEGCSQLEEIIIGEQVASVGWRAFSTCSALRRVVWNPTHCGYWEYGCILPHSVNRVEIGANVESIPNYMCYGCSNLTTITLPNGLTEIGAGAFYKCSSLTEIVLPSSLTNISAYAFKETDISELSLPNSSLTIGAFAFADTKISELIIPENVQSIAPCAFDGCTALTKINYNATYASLGRCIDKRSSSYSYYYASPFTGMSNEVEISIGANVQYIPPYFFTQCSRLQGSSNLYSGKWSASYIPEYQESSNYDCPRLTSKGFNTIFSSVTFEQGSQLRTIGTGAFAYCSDLKKIDLPATLQHINECAFIGCSGLTELILPQSIRIIKESALYGCSSLKKIKVPAGANVYTDGYTFYNTGISDQNNYLYDWAQNLDTIIVPANMFDFEEKYWSVAPKNVKYIEVNSGTLTENAFAVINRSYKQLKTLDISATENTTLADEAFKGCYNLENLMLPNKLQYVGYMAVADCKHLKAIDIPASVEEIDDSAFENCRSIESITFGGNQPAAVQGKHMLASSGSALRRIGNWAFYNAHELQHLEIPQGVTEIGDGAFYGCTYLEDLTLPASVQSIGDNTFALCAKMKKIVVNAVTPPAIQAKTFFDVKRQIPVYVPDECVDAYKNDAYWCEFNIQGRSHIPQSIDNINADTKAQKIVRNNQIFILRGNKTYTLTGQEVK